MEVTVQYWERAAASRPARARPWTCRRCGWGPSWGGRASPSSSPSPRGGPASGREWGGGWPAEGTLAHISEIFLVWLHSRAEKYFCCLSVLGKILRYGRLISDRLSYQWRYNFEQLIIDHRDSWQRRDWNTERETAGAVELLSSKYQIKEYLGQAGVESCFVIFLTIKGVKISPHQIVILATSMWQSDSVLWDYFEISNPQSERPIIAMFGRRADRRLRTPTHPHNLQPVHSAGVVNWCWDLITVAQVRSFLKNKNRK